MPLDGIALQTLKTAVVDEDLALVTCKGCRILSQQIISSVSPRGLRTCKHQVGAHFRYSPGVVLLVAAIREDGFSREPPRIIRAKKYGHARDVLGLAYAAQ